MSAEAKREERLLKIHSALCDELGVEEKDEHAPMLVALNDAYNLGAEKSVEQACAVPAPAVVTPEPTGGGKADEYASESVWAELRGLYEIAKKAWAVRTSTDPEAPGELDEALDFYANVALPAHLARIVKPVPYPRAAEAGKAQATPAVEAWVPGQPKWDWAPWARFLGARSQLIHEALAEGKSAEEICAQLSMDVGQVRLIGWTDLSSIPGIPGNVWPPPPKGSR